MLACPWPWDLEKSRSPVGSGINEIHITQIKVGYDNTLKTNAANLDATQAMKSGYDAIILAVVHDAFKTLGLESIQHYGKSTHVLMDIKAVFPKSQGILRI
jgi:UDP-N-acetyl-D-mannosaminuronate dehydrogenase